MKKISAAIGLFFLFFALPAFSQTSGGLTQSGNVIAGHAATWGPGPGQVQDGGALASGTVSSGTTGQVAVYTGSTAVGSNSGITFSGSIPTINSGILSGVTTLPGSGNSIGATGIGTFPSLVVTGSTQSGLILVNTSSGINGGDFYSQLMAGNGNQGWSMQNTSAGAAAAAVLQIGNNTSENEFMITLNGGGNSSGNGANSATISNGGPIYLSQSGGNIFLKTLITGTNADFLCLTAGAQVVIQSSACTISSLRFKPDWKSYDGDAISIVSSLDVGTFHVDLGPVRNPDPNAYSLQAGLNAENIAKVFPLAAVYEQDMRTPKSYRQEAVIGLLVKADQQEDAKLDAFISATAKQIYELQHANDNSFWHKIGIAAGFEK